MMQKKFKFGWHFYWSPRQDLPGWEKKAGLDSLHSAMVPDHVKDLVFLDYIFVPDSEILYWLGHHNKPMVQLELNKIKFQNKNFKHYLVKILTVNVNFSISFTFNVSVYTQKISWLSGLLILMFFICCFKNHPASFTCRSMSIIHNPKDLRKQPTDITFSLFLPKRQIKILNPNIYQCFFITFLIL